MSSEPQRNTAQNPLKIVKSTYLENYCKIDQYLQKIHVLSWISLDLIQSHVSVRSTLLEAAYLEALLYRYISRQLNQEHNLADWDLCTKLKQPPEYYTRATEISICIEAKQLVFRYRADSQVQMNQEQNLADDVCLKQPPEEY